MSWEIFRAEYKQGLENNDDMAKVIAESYRYYKYSFDSNIHNPGFT